MIKRFTDLVAYAKAATPTAILNDSEIKNLSRRAESFGISNALEIIANTPPARLVNPKTGEVLR